MRAVQATIELLKESASRWIDDECYRLGASLAYYALFSLFPLLMLSVTGLGFALGDDDAVRARILASVDTGTPEVRALMDQTLTSMQKHQTARGIGAFVGIVTLLFGASGAFSELDTAVQRIWRCVPGTRSSMWKTIFTTMKERATSFALVAAASVVLLASLITSTTLSALQASASNILPYAGAWQLVELGVSSAFSALLFAAAYRGLPTCKVAWRDVIGGAVLTTALFTLFKRVLTWYLAHLGSYAAYGAIGAVLGLLLWIYMSTLLFFFGAEFTRVYAERFGSLAKATQASRRDETRAECVSEVRQPERPSRAHSLP